MYQFHCRPAADPAHPPQSTDRRRVQCGRMKLPLSLRGYLKLLAAVQAGFLLAFAVTAMNASSPPDASNPTAAPSAAPDKTAPPPLTRPEVRALLSDRKSVV